MAHSQSNMLNEGALDEMLLDHKKDKKSEYRKKRYGETKIEKLFIQKRVPLPLAHLFGKMLLADEAVLAEPFTPGCDLGKVYTIPIGDNAGDAKISQELFKFTSDNPIIKKKASNLISKMKANAAMVCKELDTNALTFAEIPLSSAGLKAITTPFIVAIDLHSWSWHVRAWPCASMGCIVLCLKDRMFASLYDVDDLITQNLKALVSLPELKCLKGGDPQILSKVPHIDVEITMQDALYIPPGKVPLITGVPAADDDGKNVSGIEGNKAVALVIPVLGKSCLAMTKRTTETKILVKQYIEHSLSEFGEDKSFAIAKDAIKSWVAEWSD